MFESEVYLCTPKMYTWAGPLFHICKLNSLKYNNLSIVSARCTNSIIKYEKMLGMQQVQAFKPTDRPDGRSPCRTNIAFPTRCREAFRPAALLWTCRRCSAQQIIRPIKYYILYIWLYTDMYIDWLTLAYRVCCVVCSHICDTIKLKWNKLKQLWNSLFCFIAVGLHRSEPLRWNKSIQLLCKSL